MGPEDCCGDTMDTADQGAGLQSEDAFGVLPGSSETGLPQTCTEPPGWDLREVPHHGPLAQLLLILGEAFEFPFSSLIQSKARGTKRSLSGAVSAAPSEAGPLRHAPD